jgi:hypothetical protein
MYRSTRIIIVFIFIILISGFSYTQRDVDSILDYTLSYRGLTRNDITIPIEFFSSAEKNPTNEVKLILPLVKNIMINPLSSMVFMDSVMYYKDLELDKLVLQLFHNINFDSVEVKFTAYSFSTDPDELLKTLERKYRESGEHQNNLLKVYTKDELEFLQKNLLSIFEETDENDKGNFDIFKYNEERDSSTAISKRTMDLLAKADRNLIYQYSMEEFFFCYQFYKFLSKNKSEIIKNFKSHGYEDDYVLTSEIDGRKIAIGGPGNNRYEGDYAVIIDLGGNDVYDLSIPPLTKGGFRNNFNLIIDLSGNDIYSSNSDFTLAGSLFNSGFIFDKSGDDVYQGRNVTLGSAICGLGLLYDESGNDTYHCISFCEGAGSFGAGLLVDREGNDFYIANSYSQAFGMTEGIGTIVDNKGNDSYLVDARSLDIGRYEDHYVSMCQGYGLGLRPYYAGGIGLLIEGEGNDIYNTDIFGQGGAYWYSLGVLVDKSGHDKYNGYQYSQGAGIHLAVGLLKDYDGWDFYQSDGVSQGCGHDFGFGLLYDVKGNDNYSCYSLSQGAGNANGIGMFIDESGLDGYLAKDPNNTRGYGNPRREYGSIGVFIDASGEDYYSSPGTDSTIINSSTWGVMNDFNLTDLPSQVSGSSFKVEFDTVKLINEHHDNVRDYFTMAKTIEPRFSLWQEYGFNKLIQDSTETADFLLTKLNTDDARETLVMRNLSRKIEYSIGRALVNKLEQYLKNRSGMKAREISLACYILGETTDPSGKNTLLQLTYDDNLRIRSSALNALGKIYADSTDIEFNNKVSQRLIELAKESREEKLYNKDIAYAFKNYKNPTSIDALIGLLSYDYYGVRFLASDASKDYWENNPDKLNDAVVNLSDNRTAFQALLFSLNGLSDEKFKLVIEKILTLDIANDEIVNINLIALLKDKFSLTQDNFYKGYYSGILSRLESNSTMKVK